MTQGYHAADDGSLARSTGGAAARGAMLIALALIIGLFLMAFALDDPQTDLSVGAGDGAAGDVGDDGTGDAAADDGTGDAEGATEPSVSVGDPEDNASATDTIPEVDDTAAVTETIPETPEGALNAPADVNILVANGTGQAGVAGFVADQLQAQAYFAAVSNAPSTAEAVIFYRDGYAEDARAVADILGAPVDIVTVAPADGTIAVSSEAVSDGRLGDANVIVIIGADNNIPVG